ncbi:MAG: FYDLN acid domain-containing protein, partial [Lachnospiraceae bacterium]|nr:FYDLN acid domain-containing protein [Lachnospiraceae bacterium]
MAERVTTYQCPSCTGPLHYDGQTGRLVCDYCGSSYTLEEVKAFCESRNEAAAEADHKAEEKERKEAAEQAAAAEAEAAGAAGAQDGQAAKEAGGASGKQAGETSGGSWGKDAARMRAYNCTTCGAELLCDDTMAAFNCPYCGNATIIPGHFDGTGRPDHVLPFKISREQALETLKGYYKGKHLLPSSFASANHLEEIKGVYVPFWLFNGEADVDIQFAATRVRRHISGDREITETDHFAVRRAGS